MFDELKVKHENVIRKERDGSCISDYFFRLAYYSQLFLMEGLIFYHFTALKLEFSE